MNSFGRLFRISIYGESHGQEVGVLIDGCPAGLPLREDDFHIDLSRRKSGSKGSTPRVEDDLPLIKSGLFKHKTTGTPILISFTNKNTKSHDYESIRDVPRPGHADFTALKKYGGFQDYRGGGHFSGRLTLGLVAAGVIAKKIITPITPLARILEVGGQVDIQKAIDNALAEKDSIGGLIECQTEGIPAGLGEPFFESVESQISQLVFSIPAVRGIEFGSGFSAAKMKGSEHNDTIIDREGKTLTNHAGGINGGITNGNPLIFRVAIKPPSSIALPQETINLKTAKLTQLKIEGRHDTCIALRIPVILESITAIALADMMIQQQEIPKLFK